MLELRIDSVYYLDGAEVIFKEYFEEGGLRFVWKRTRFSTSHASPAQRSMMAGRAQLASTHDRECPSQTPSLQE